MSPVRHGEESSNKRVGSKKERNVPILSNGLRAWTAQPMTPGKNATERRPLVAGQSHPPQGQKAWDAPLGRTRAARLFGREQERIGVYCYGKTGYGILAL